MNQLITINKMTSMQIAEVAGKEHYIVMRDIRDESQKLENGGVETQYKFVLSERKDSTGRTIPFYILTKEGVLQLAARYDAVVRAKLIKMAMRQEEKPTCLEDILITQLQEMKVLRLQLTETNNTAIAAKQDAQEAKRELQSMREVIVLNPNSWRPDTSKIINDIARNLGGVEHIRNVRTEAYKLLDSRFGVSLETRLTNKRRKMAEEGVCKSKRDKTNQLDVIADDKKLIEGFVAIVKEMAVKYGVETAEMSEAM